MTEEIWKDIVGYNGRYQISSFGNVKAIYKYRESKILIPMINKDGYLQVNLSDGKRIRHHRIHRLVAEAFIKNEECKPCINHKDFNKKNNHVENLEWCSTEYNLQYGSERKIGKKKYRQYILTDKDVMDIKTNCIPHSKSNNIAIYAKKYNVSKCCISNICSGKSWKHIKEEII